MFFLCVSVFHVACYYILSSSADRLVVGEGIYVHKEMWEICARLLLCEVLYDKMSDLKPLVLDNIVWLN